MPKLFTILLIFFFLFCSESIERVTTSYETGEKKEHYFIIKNSTKKHGKYEKWNKNETKTQESNWKKGEKHGIFTEWYDEGLMKSRGYWEKGKQNGRFTWWGETGEIKEEKYFDKGIMQDIKEDNKKTGGQKLFWKDGKK